MPAIIIQFGFGMPSGKRSKICISIVYLWIGRGPEINNGASAAMSLNGMAALPGTSASPADGFSEEIGDCSGGRERSATVAAGSVASTGSSVSLTEEEFEEVSSAAERSGMARGAFAAEAALASARGGEPRVYSPLREALAELIAAAGLVRRVGTNLNQAVAKLNATGQRGENLLPAAQFCARVIRRLDETAEQLRRAVP
jgi:hypothetical protein